MNQALGIKRLKALFVLVVGFSLMSLDSSLMVVSEAADEVAAVHKIGIVNLEKVFHEYDRTKASDSQFGQLSNTKQQDREKMVSEIKNIREELALLNEESRVERQGTVEEKLRQLASFDRKAKEDLRKQWDQTVKAILDDIEATVNAYAKGNGYTLILNERAVLYGIEAIDVTDKILSILNERYAKRKS